MQKLILSAAFFIFGIPNMALAQFCGGSEESETPQTKTVQAKLTDKNILPILESVLRAHRSKMTTEWKGEAWNFSMTFYGTDSDVQKLANSFTKMGATNFSVLVPVASVPAADTSTEYQGTNCP